MATARGGRSCVLRIFRNAATQMSAACSAPTSAAACHTGSSSTAAKKTALATLTLTLRLMWSGNSRARIPAAASETMSHQSAVARFRRPTVATRVASATTPIPSRKSSDRRRGAMAQVMGNVKVR